MTVERSGTIPTNYTICTSSTRPASPLVGRMIYETDTKNYLIYDGAVWVGITSAESDVLTWV